MGGKESAWEVRTLPWITVKWVISVQPSPQKPELSITAVANHKNDGWHTAQKLLVMVSDLSLLDTKNKAEPTLSSYRITSQVTTKKIESTHLLSSL